MRSNGWLWLQEPPVRGILGIAGIRFSAKGKHSLFEMSALVGVGTRGASTVSEETLRSINMLLDPQTRC